MHRRRIALLTLLLLASFVAVPIVLMWPQVRQARINRQLVVAVWALDVSQVRDCLRAGADPNLSEDRPEPVSFRQALFSWFRSRPDMEISVIRRNLLSFILFHATNDDRVRNMNAEKQRRCCDIALLLLKYGGRPEPGYSEELNAAICLDSMDVVIALLDCGADVNSIDDQNRSPLLEAASMNRTRLGLLLLNRGANPNLADDSHRTPILEATQNGNEVLVKALLAKKADPTVQDADGNTLLALARSEKQTTIIGLLKQAGAKN